MGKRFPFSGKNLLGWEGGRQNRTAPQLKVKRGTIKLSYNICVTFTHALTSREATDIKTNGEHPDSPNAGRMLQFSQLCSWDCKARDQQRSLFLLVLLLVLAK